MRFSDEDVARFAAWSADRNPLHVDASFARQTYFGQPIVHGILTVLGSLASGSHHARGQRVHTLELEFRSAAVAGTEYSLERSDTADGFALTLRDGGTTVLTIQAQTGAPREPGGDLLAWAGAITGRDAPVSPALRDAPAHRSLDELSRGVAVTGTYPAEAATEWWSGAASISPAQARVLALCSYITGMELPGLRSLFTRVSVQFHNADAGGPLRYRAQTVRCDPQFRMLETALHVVTPEGVPVATAVLRSYVPFSPVHTDIRELTRRLTPSTARLQGKVALVIGGSRGLGADIASALALAGSTVYATARHHDPAAVELQRLLQDQGGALELLQGNAGDADWCQSTLDMLRGRHGRLDLLVLSACAPPSHVRIGREALRRQGAYLAENLALVEAPLATFVELIDASDGAVVYLSSAFVQDSPPGFGHYVALKQSGEALVRTAVREYPGLSSVIARPRMLQTRWNDTPAVAASAIPADQAASQIVNRLAEAWQAGHVELITEFPPFAAPVPASAPQQSREPAFAIRVAASFTTDALLPGLRFWIRELAIDGDVEVAPYGQVVQSLLDPNSLFASRARGVNVVLLRLRDWLRELPEHQSEALDFVRTHLQEAASELERALRAHRGRATAETLLVLCPSYGGASSAENIILREAEADLAAKLATVSGLTVVAASDYHAHYGVNEDQVSDALRDEIAHIPYHDGYLHVLATIVARTIHPRLAALRKAIVVDCDNTLWRGVVGEVGAEGVEFDAGHRFLQETLIRLSEAGVLVCLCSKNDEADVWRVFDTRDDFLLRREHVVAAAINWLPKSQNLRALASRLNLGVDSFIFIDDNPLECAEVRASCPEVLTLLWPQQPERAMSLLRHTWELDATNRTAEDQRRTHMYREERQRQELREETLTFDAFIESLQLVVDIAPLSDEDLRRAAQLTLRTNQFNFTTRRREEPELQALVSGGRHDIRTVRVRDRFGDYGLVGLVIVEHGAEVWDLDTFLLSCRVLGRGVEHRIISEVGRMAVAAGARSVRLRVEFTTRNMPARMFLESIVPPERRTLGEQALECEPPAPLLASVAFEPNAVADAAVSADGEAPGPAPQAVDPARARRREEQIERAAFELSTVSGLQAVIEDRTAATLPSSLPSGEIGDIVYAAFANALRLPIDTVKEVDRLDALGCDSLRIVEITVALREQFPGLPSTLLFEHRSIGKILAEIQALASAGSDAALQTLGAPAVVAARASVASSDVAVVGMHLRCAGANSPDELWDLLSLGRSAVRPVPPERKYFLRRLNDARPHWAGLLDNPARFDAEFFGVSPREAEYMDPQLRLFLEVAWSAVEDAGCAGTDHDPDTGVFVGVMYGDYGLRANRSEADSPYRCWEGFSLANRLSQLFDFHGPSLAVDTACSSSGTALHLACRALNTGDCRVALVGGVNLILESDRFASLGRLGILSANGSCEPFGAGANGTVLGEGAGVVVLRPLDEALRRGDRIYGIVKGTGLSTGNGTVGFTAPNPQAQAKAIRRSIEAAGVDPRTITYVETHGTGTALGDPIEVRGLTLGYTQAPLTDPALQIEHRCRIGSIKPNVGHLEAGAGVIGLIKVLLQLHHRTLVPSITSEAPNPQIPFSETPFQVQRALEPWEPLTVMASGRQTIVPRRAGLSSFGVGGANAHVIVEEAPPSGHARHASAADRPVHLLALSARTEEALQKRITHLKEYIEAHPDSAAADIAYTTNVGRKHFDHRVAVAGHSREELLTRLDALAHGAEARGVVRGLTSPSAPPPKVAFLFTGQGSQYAGMGKQLYDTQPVFRNALDRCAGPFDSLLTRPLLDLLFAESAPDAGLLNQTGFTQPALFAFEYALAALWQSWGIRPDVVMGHSVGEIGALCVAGGVSLEDGLKLIAARGRLMQALPPGGTMTSVMADEGLVLEAISGCHDVTIAAINAPRQVVISGAGTAVAEITARLTADGIKTKALTVSHAFHSPLMKPMLAEYERVVRTIRFTPPRIPFVSCVDGTLVSDEVTRPEYWLRQVMEPVRFADGMRALESQGVRAYIEIGPQPVLLGMGRQCVGEGGGDLDWLPSLRADADAWQMLLGSLSALYVKGAPVDWKGFDAPYRRRRVSLPPYAFREKEYWLGGTRTAATAAPAPAADTPPQLYELTWRQQPALPDSLQRARSFAWVIFADRQGLGAQLGRLLAANGADPTIVTAGDRYRKVAEHAYEIDCDNPDDYTRIWSAVTARSGADVRVVHLLGLNASIDPSPHQDAHVTRPVETLLHLTRVIAARAHGNTALWCVTQGAIVVDETAVGPVAVAQAPLWGFGRTVALEHPEIWGGLVDLTPGGAVDELRLLANEIIAGGAEDQTALRDSRRYAARLAHRQERRRSPLALQGDAAYVVTGGVGALGSHVARWLVGRGARHIVLTSRRGAADARAQSAVAATEQLGASVALVAADISQAEGVDALMAVIRDRGLPLRGIVHAAGIDAPAPVRELSVAGLRAVMAPKVDGGWLLHERTRDLPLDFFVLFSSVASVLGSNGRAHYAAANAFLDALAQERRRLGLPALAINWGPWKGGGMASDEHLRAFERVGNRGLEPGAALRALDRLVDGGDVQASAMDVDWATFKPIYEARRPRPVVADISSAPLRLHATAPVEAEPAAKRAAGSSSVWVERLQAVPAAERPAQLAALLRSEVADTLGFEDAASVAPAANFYDIGMDSLMMADLVSRLNKRLGVSSGGLVFEHPTVESLASALLDRVAVADASSTLQTAPAVPAGVANSGTSGYQPEIEEEIFRFQALAWPRRNPELIPSRWRWMVVESAQRLGRAPIVWIHRDNGAIVGHMGAVPVRLKIGCEERETAWCVDTMVLESHRSRAVGSRLMVDAQETLPFALSLGQTSEMRQICLRLGWKQVAPLQVAQLLVRPERVFKGKLPPPAAWAAGIGWRARAAARDLWHERTTIRTREVSRFSERHDQLWRESARDIGCAVVRDASYLNWKYVDQPGQEFVRLEMLDGDTVRGVAVWTFREPDDAYTYRRALLVDLVVPFSDDALVQRVIRAACAVPAEHGADALVCMHISDRLTRGLGDCGFTLRQPDRFLLVDPGPLAGPALEHVLSSKSWYVTQGDSDIDRPW